MAVGKGPKRPLLIHQVCCRLGQDRPRIVPMEVRVTFEKCVDHASRLLGRECAHTIDKDSLLLDIARSGGEQRKLALGRAPDVFGSRPPAEIRCRPSRPLMFIAVEDLISGDAGNTELPAQGSHSFTF